MKHIKKGYWFSFVPQILWQPVFDLSVSHWPNSSCRMAQKVFKTLSYIEKQNLTNSDIPPSYQSINSIPNTQYVYVGSCLRYDITASDTDKWVKHIWLNFLKMWLILIKYCLLLYFNLIFFWISDFMEKVEVCYLLILKIMEAKSSWEKHKEIPLCVAKVVKLEW